MATKLAFLVAKFKVLVALATVSVAISSPAVVKVSQFTSLFNALISGHPQGLTPRNPQAFATRHLKIPPTQGQYSSTKILDDFQFTLNILVDL